MGLTRSLSILVIMVIAFTAEAKLKPVTAADLESTCWASGWFGHYPNYDAQVFLFNTDRTGKLEVFKKNRGLTFLAPVTWSAEGSILTYTYQTDQDSVEATSFNMKMSDDGEYLYLEGSKPYWFQRSTYPQTPECSYPW